MADIGYGPQALALLKQGMAPADVVKKVWDDDPDPQPQNWSKQGRQLAVINTKGEAAAFTGEKDAPWAGHKIGKNCTAQGNILAGEEVVNGMVDGFEKTEGHLAYRLLAALEGGQDGRRRQARHAIGQHDHRQEKRRPLAPQRHGAPPAGRRQRRAN